MPFEPITYSDLNAREQEIYNFQKISGILADYGFQTLRLTNDWNGADFLAQKFSDETILRVQQKGRFCIAQRYLERGLYVVFYDHAHNGCYLYQHDAAVRFVEENNPSIFTQQNWINAPCEYHVAGVPNWLIPFLQDCFYPRLQHG